MVLGRRELGAILLGVAAIVFYLVLLSTTPSGAQTNGNGTTSRTTSQNGDSDEGCPNPEEVATFTGTENQITDEFDITGSTFRVSFETTVVDPDDPGSPSLEFDVLDETGDPIGQGELVFDEADDSTNILAGPGTFSLEIVADNVEYTVTVEDCAGTDEDTDLDDDTVLDDDDDEPVQRTTRPGGRTVINVPNKPLPPTGGLPVYVVTASFVLTGAGLLALGLVIRRGPRG